ncbi:DUF4436 family protein [Nocardia sp. NBC_00511]|uniref:DUF4436 family protein n=1 Tax=Nocardia sp. NBC_00511 TaxID=2903591 RepID=UPI0030E2EC4E
MRRGRRFLAVGGIVVLLISVMAGSLAVYRAQKEHGRAISGFGDIDHPDRVDLYVWVIRIDAAAQQVALQITPTPQGRFANSGGTFTADLLVYGSGQRADPIKVAAGEQIPSFDRTIAMGGGGMITDYPFDKYDADLGFVAEIDGAAVPVVVQAQNGDAFFTVTPQWHDTAQPIGQVGLMLHITRSPAAQIFAIFVMVLMLGLALAAAIVGYYLITRQRVIVIPAYTFLAALLFALIPLRNAVPASPPIGSIIDFTSFFPAEAIIALTLIVAVIHGYRSEVRAAESA